MASMLGSLQIISILLLIYETKDFLLFSCQGLQKRGWVGRGVGEQEPMERLPSPTRVETLWWKSHENEVTGTISQRLAEARAPADNPPPSPFWLNFFCWSNEETLQLNLHY